MTLAVVLGDGVDALVAAHYLRKAGHDVTLLHDREHAPAGEIEPGWVPLQIVQDLSLEQHGFAFEANRVWARVALGQGDTLDLGTDVAESAQAIRRVSPRDAERWPEFCARMQKLGQLLATLYAVPPPDPLSSDLAELVSGALAALRVRQLGRQGIEDLLRMLPMSIADLLDEWFESDRLKGVLGGAGVLNLCQGTRSSGTAFNFLHHHAGSAPGVFRPPRSNVRHVLRSLGGVTTRECDVSRILMRYGHAIGIVLASGETIAADVVVSGLDPARTLIEMSDPGLLDPELVRALRNVRRRGVGACVTFELDGVPDWSMLAIAPSLDYLERAYDDVKYGRVSDQPYIEAHAYRGGGARCRLNVHVQYVPHALTTQANDEARAALGPLVRNRLSPYVQGMMDATLVRTMTPADFAKQARWPQGQPCHAEIALDQALWMRPVPQLARYRTPFDGLYLCGPAMHPGTPVAGAAGANAASIILRDLKKGRRRRGVLPEP